VDALQSALANVTSLEHLSFLSLGVVLGLIVGILPGLGGTAGLALLLPFLFGMEPSLALAMMIGLVAVTCTSDTFPSVLMGIPGSSSSQATVLDGFPLAKKGQAARALSAAFFASLIGGLVGALMLTGAVFVARPVILAIGFAEQMMLILLALSMVGMLTGASMTKGFAACGMGLLIGVVGPAPATGVPRVTFDYAYLYEPISLVIVGLGMFAVPEIVDLARRGRSISDVKPLGRGWIAGLKDNFQHFGLILRCSSAGALLGAMPGLGGTVIDWIAYGHAVQTARDRSEFGKGDIRGVLAPESATNAKEGGALVPTLLFGIPGSGSMALLLGGLILIGIEPGLGMVERHLDLTYTVIWSLAIANIVVTALCIVLAPQIARLTQIPFAWIAPFLIGIIFFAAYQATRSWGDLIALLVLGMVGVYMKRFGWPRPALLIGFVLSTKIEATIYQTVQVYGFSFMSRPIAMGLLALTIVSLILGAKMKQSTEPDSGHTRGAEGILPQAAFWGSVAIFALVVLWDSIGKNMLTSIYPRVAGSFTLLMLVIMGGMVLAGRGTQAVLYDSEKSPNVAGPHGNLHYLGWIVGMLITTSLLGFVLAIAGFIAIFLRVKAGAVLWACALSAAAFVGLLAVLGHFLVLEYPQGILQSVVAMPWPLN